MTIEKAIEDLKELIKFGPSFAWWHHTPAVLLGIEAMKRVQSKRAGLSHHYDPLLPGETKE